MYLLLEKDLNAMFLSVSFYVQSLLPLPIKILALHSIIGLSGITPQEFLNGITYKVPFADIVCSSQKNSNVSRLLHIKMVYDTICLLLAL